MRSILFAIAAFSTAVLAQQASGPNAFKIPQGFSLTAGKPTDIQWTPTTQGTVTLRLREGANSDLNAGTVIGSNLPNNGAFTFTPPADTVRNSDYTIEIVSDTDPTKINYTPQFVIESSNTVASVTSSSSASASTTTSGSSSPTSGSSTTSASSGSSTSSTPSSTMTSGSSTSTVSTTSSSTSGSSSSGSKSSSSTGSTTLGMSTSASSTGSSSSSPASASATSAPKNGAVGKSAGVGGVVIAVILGAVAAW